MSAILDSIRPGDTAADLGERLGLPTLDVVAALNALHAAGLVVRRVTGPREHPGPARWWRHMPEVVADAA